MIRKNSRRQTVPKPLPGKVSGKQKTLKIGAIPRRARPLPQKSASSAANGSAMPTWVFNSVFERAKIAAWQGFVGPLEVTSIHPENLPFVKALDLGRASGTDWASIIHPLDRARVQNFFRDIQSAALPTYLEYRVVDPQGSVVWLRHGVEAHARVGARTRIQGFIEDIQAEKEFQLESLRVSEREQNRIGQDLHDDLCQVLAGVSCLMRVFEGRIAAKAPEEVDNLKELNLQIIDAMHRTRALTHGLFPGKIQVADIRGALLELASQVKARFKVDIKTQFVGRFPKHSTAQIIQIYRISQEAMSNAIKHGRATEISVRLEAHTDSMELSIKDNGLGFSKNDGASSGVGLNIMSYRASALGGEFNLSSAPNQGATARLTYPFETAG